MELLHLQGKPLKTHQHSTETTTLQSTCLSLSTWESFTDRKSSQYPCWNYTRSNLCGMQQTNSELSHTGTPWAAARKAGRVLSYTPAVPLKAGLNHEMPRGQARQLRHIPAPTQDAAAGASWSLCHVFSPGCVHLVQESCDPFCSRDILSISRTSVKPWDI